MSSRNPNNVDVDCCPCLIDLVPWAVSCLSLSLVCIFYGISVSLVGGGDGGGSGGEA